MGQFLLRLFSKVTYIHKLILIGILMLLSLIICLFFIWKNLEGKILKVSRQLESAQNAQMVKKQLDHISHHAFLIATEQLDQADYPDNEAHARFSSFAERLRTRLLYIGTPLFQTGWVPYYLTNLAFVELVQGQTLLAQIMLPQTEASSNAFKTLLEAHLDNLNMLIEATGLNSEAELVKLIDAYRKTTLELIPNQNPNFKLKSSLIDAGMKALRENFTIWEEVFDRTQHLLIDKLRTFESQKRWIVAGSAALVFLALLIALLSFLQAQKPLKSMLQAIQKFKAGDFTIRIPITYKDEIGGFGILLNQIGDRFEETVKEMEQTKNLLNTYSHSLASASKHLESHTNEQETTRKQLGEAAKEISNQAQEFFCMMQTINESEEETSLLVESGTGSLAKMESDMQEMVESLTKTTAKLTVLNDKVQTAKLLISTMSNVARQTNLLSFNAAIEAEKAGEQGKGFAVISREIRHLAEQSAHTTLEMEKMIQGIFSIISASISEVDKLFEKVHQSSASVRNMRDYLWRIQKQTEKQKNTIEGVDKGLKAQFKGTEKISSTALHLAERTRQMDLTIRQFLDVK